MLCAHHFESSPNDFSSSTVEPRFNVPLFNEVLDITNDILGRGQSYHKMYGIEPRYNEPRYNEFFDITNIIRKPKCKIYLDITNYSVNTRQKINAEQINSQQILVILMVKRQQTSINGLLYVIDIGTIVFQHQFNFCFIFFEIRKCWIVQHNNTKGRFLVLYRQFSV